MDKKKELQGKYEDLYGKKAYYGWNEKELQEKIDAKSSKEEAGKSNVESGKPEETVQPKIEKVTPEAQTSKEEIIPVEKPKEVTKPQAKKEVAKEEIEEDEEPEEFEIDPNKTYHFRLIQNSTNPRKILPREAKVWHEPTETTRLIRLCSTEKSPYVDEQDENAVIDRKPLIITDGNLFIEGTEANRIKFLLAFDGNAAKSKTLTGNGHIAKMYELVDNQKEVADKLTAEEAELEARILVKDANEEELRNYLRSTHLLDVDNMTSKEVRLKGNDLAKNEANAKDILKNFNNPIHKIKAKVQKLFGAGELDDKEDVVRWKNGSIILQLKKGERADDALAKWVLEGSQGAKDFVSVADSKLKG